jgi:hypothetical protein
MSWWVEGESVCVLCEFTWIKWCIRGRASTTEYFQQLLLQRVEARYCCFTLCLRNCTVCACVCLDALVCVSNYFQRL